MNEKDMKLAVVMLGLFAIIIVIMVLTKDMTCKSKKSTQGCQWTDKMKNYFATALIVPTLGQMGYCKGTDNLPKMAACVMDKLSSQHDVKDFLENVLQSNKPPQDIEKIYQMCGASSGCPSPN